MLCPSCRAENDEAARACVACRTPLRVVAAGSVVAGRYEVRQTLGRGGMGTVYRAHDRVLDETVALKILRADVAGSPGMAARFRSEIKLARRVSHWNVCRIYEYGEDAGLQFISMELLEGENLKERLARAGPPPAADAFALAVQVAEGLAAVHQAGIVHRDLKTPNIMVDGKGAVRVMDFGIARAAEGRGDATGYVLGSPEYMSPEQARGLPADFRSDVYALGVVVFEIFSGRVPFRADTPVATLLMHLEREPPLRGPDAPALPEPLLPFLSRALAKEPAARYADGGEAAAALRTARAGGASKGAAHVAAPRGSRRTAALSALAALAIATGAAALWRSVRVGTPVTPSPVPSTHPAPVAPPSASPGDTFASESATPAAPPATPRPEARPTSPPLTATPSPPAAIRTPVPDAPVRPTPRAEATPSPPAPAPLPSPGALLVVVRPWADVAIDGVVVGQTPLRRIPLAPGPHSVLLSHPDFQPFPRRVTIREGETFRLTVDLATEGVRRR